MPVLDAFARPRDHRSVHRRVVQVLHRPGLGPQDDQVEQDHDPDDHERPPGGRLGAGWFEIARRRGVLAFGDGPAHPPMLPRPRREPGQPPEPERESGPEGPLAMLDGERLYAVWAASAVPFIRFGSIGTPGPIVVETVSVFTYLPFALDGRARMISSTTAR